MLNRQYQIVCLSNFFNIEALGDQGTIGQDGCLAVLLHVNPKVYLEMYIIQEYVDS